MKRCILSATIQPDYDEISKRLAAGWVLDPSLTDGKPFRLEFCTVWPLVLHEEGDPEPEVLEEERKPGPLEDICEVIDVDTADVAGKYKEGYRVQEIFSKNVKMVKRLDGKESVRGEKC